MINPDHISESLETIFCVIILKLFDGDPGWKKFGYGIRAGKHSDPGSGINIPDPQHCVVAYLLVTWRVVSSPPRRRVEDTSVRRTGSLQMI
jgi:hypothetical protein